MSGRAGLTLGASARGVKSRERRISRKVTVAKLVRRRATVKHVEVRDYLYVMATHELQPGDPVPSERELCDRFGVSRMTVRQAVDALAVQGLLQRVQGSGTFVARPKVDLQVRLTSFSEEMRRRGMTPSVRNLRAEEIPASSGVARALELSTGDPVVHLHQLRLADDEPMSVEHTWLPAVLVPGLLDDGPPASLYVALERRGILPTWGEDSVDAGDADPEEARLLGIPSGRSVLRIARRAFNADVSVEYSRSVYRSDRYTLWVPLARPNRPVVPRHRTSGPPTP
jgi:GntR family transcriptional regulator